jgi:hypothetical protein
MGSVPSACISSLFTCRYLSAPFTPQSFFFSRCYHRDNDLDSYSRVLGSNLTRKTGYPVCAFLQFLERHAGKLPRFSQDRFLGIHLWSIMHPTTETSLITVSRRLSALLHDLYFTTNYYPPPIFTWINIFSDKFPTINVSFLTYCVRPPIFNSHLAYINTCPLRLQFPAFVCVFMCGASLNLLHLSPPISKVITEYLFIKKQFLYFCP